MDKQAFLAAIPPMFRGALAGPLEQLLEHLANLEQRIAVLERTTTTGEPK